MKAYWWVARSKIIDAIKYKKLQTKFFNIILKFGRKFLARGRKFKSQFHNIKSLIRYKIVFVR